MTEYLVTTHDLDELAEKLDSITSRFSEQDVMLLHLLFRLAAQALAEGPTKQLRVKRDGNEVETANRSPRLAKGFLDAFKPLREREFKVRDQIDAQTGKLSIPIII